MNVPKGLPQLVQCSFKRLMEHFDVGVIPLLFWSSQKTSVVLAEYDPDQIDFPCSLDNVLPLEHYRDLCTKTLQTLVKPLRVEPKVITELGRHVPQHTPRDMASTTTQAHNMLRACNTCHNTSGAVQTVPLRSVKSPRPCSGCPPK